MQKQINDLLLVSVPEDAYRFSIITNSTYKDRFGRLEFVYRNTGLDGSIKLFPELEPLLSDYIYKNLSQNKKQDIFWDAKAKYDLAIRSLKFVSEWPITFLQSFESLMQANGVYLVNPLGEEPKKIDFIKLNSKMAIFDKSRFNTALSNWRAAQESTSTKWVVLQVIK